MTIAIVLLSLLHLRFGEWQDISALESGLVKAKLKDASWFNHFGSNKHAGATYKLGVWQLRVPSTTSASCASHISWILTAVAADQRR